MYAMARSWTRPQVFGNGVVYSVSRSLCSLIAIERMSIDHDTRLFPARDQVELLNQESRGSKVRHVSVHMGIEDVALCCCFWYLFAATDWSSIANGRDVAVREMRSFEDRKA